MGAIEWRRVVRMGLIGAIVGIYVCMVGIVGIFATRPIIAGVISLGQTSLLLTLLGAGYLGARRSGGGATGAVVSGAIAGLIAGLGPALLIIIRQVVDYRGLAVQASPDLFKLLTFNLGFAGVWILPASGLILGALVGTFAVFPPRLQRPIAWGFASIVAIGLFSPLIRVPLLNSPLAGLGRFLFAPEGLSGVGALVMLVVVVGAQQVSRVAHVRRRYALLPADLR